MRTINNLEELTALSGEEIGKSDWLEISQERINDFAQATGDFQWIHLDAERCKAESPFKTTIAHGFLTLSLIPVLFAQIMEVKNIRMAVNYGLNKTRFISPVPVQSKIRLSLQIADVEPIKGGIRVINTLSLIHI